MKLILSKHKWYTGQNIMVTGFIREGDRLLREKDLADWFSTAENSEEFKKRLPDANGQFAVVIKKEDETWITTDRLRTIPLFYFKEDYNLIISDSAYAVAGEMSSCEIDEDAASAFLATGYTLNNLTLIRGLFQVEAGEMVILNTNVNRQFYFDYSLAQITEPDFNDCALELKEVIDNLFKSLLITLKDSFIVIPLSGGYDSRLIALMCKKYHPENILCCTYGRENNEEVAPAREISKRLNLPWINIIYDEKMVTGFIEDGVFKDYYPYASEFSSMFFMQDYFAVKYLKENKLIPDNSVFMPGHSGNFLAGEHIVPFMMRQKPVKSIIQHTLNENFIMQRSGKSKKKYFEMQIQKKSNGRKSGQWLIYENWDIKERQSKFIVNSASVYTFFGYEYIMPLWDNALIDFFNPLPFSFKYSKKLYDYCLTNYFFNELSLNLDKELNPTAFQLALQRLKKSVKRFLPQKVVSALINHESPVCYDVISKVLIKDAGKENFYLPPVTNNYNSFLTQWYLLKTRERFK